MRRRSDPSVLHCVGIDLALTATGLVAVPIDWNADWSRVRTLHVEPDLPASTPWEAMIRMKYIAGTVVSFVAGLGAARVRIAIENYAYDRTHGMAALAELGGILKLSLHDAGYTYAPFMMQSARKLMVGTIPRKRPKGMRVKDVVRTRATAMGMPASWSMDVGDAFVGANWLLSEYGAALMTAEEPKPKRARKHGG